MKSVKIKKEQKRRLKETPSYWRFYSIEDSYLLIFISKFYYHLSLKFNQELFILFTY